MRLSVWAHACREIACVQYVMGPHPVIHFPTEETVASLRAVADTNFGSTPTIPLCTMALMLLDAQGSEDAHRMSQNEWVLGLKNRERHLQ